MKKEELIKENEKLKKENKLLNRTLEDFEAEELETTKKFIKEMKRMSILDSVFSFLLLATIIAVLVYSISYSINQTKTRQMINNAEACIEINDDIYCKIEVKND